ncbi:MAG: hypothetical protein ACJAZS_000382 [Alteromonas naphthalenivorans]|jgi:hypothetical protein
MMNKLFLSVLFVFGCLNLNAAEQPEQDYVEQAEDMVGHAVGEVEQLVDGNAHGSEEEHANCPICLAGMIPPQAIATTPCEHSFHHECLRPWIQQKNSCPLCRANFNHAGVTTEGYMRQQGENMLQYVARVGRNIQQRVRQRLRERRRRRDTEPAEPSYLGADMMPVPFELDRQNRFLRDGRDDL